MNYCVTAEFGEENELITNEFETEQEMNAYLLGIKTCNEHGGTFKETEILYAGKNKRGWIK